MKREGQEPKLNQSTSQLTQVNDDINPSKSKRLSHHISKKLSEETLAFIAGGLDDKTLSDSTLILDDSTSDLSGTDVDTFDDMSNDADFDTQADDLSQPDDLSIDTIDQDGADALDADPLETDLDNNFDLAESHIETTFGEGDNQVTVRIDDNGNRLIQRVGGLDNIYLSHDEFNDPESSDVLTTDAKSYTFTSTIDESRTITIDQNGEIDITYPNGNVLKSTADGLSFSFYRDNTANSHFIGVENGSGFIWNEATGEIQIVDSLGNLSFSTFGNLNFVNFSDSNLASDKSFGFTTNEIAPSSITLHGDFTPIIINPNNTLHEVLMLESEAGVVSRVDTNGNFTMAWDIADVNAWNDALTSGNTVDDFVQTQLTISPQGQISILSDGSTQTFQPNTYSLSIDDENTTLSFENDNHFTVVMTFDKDGSMINETEERDFGEISHPVIVNHDLINDAWTIQDGANTLVLPEGVSVTYNDVDSSINFQKTSISFVDGLMTVTLNSTTTINYGADGRIIAAFNGDHLLISPSVKGQFNDDGSMTFANDDATVSYHAQLDGSFDALHTSEEGQQFIHIDPQGVSYENFTDQDGNVTRMSLDTILQDPNAKLTITDKGLLNIEIANTSGVNDSLNATVIELMTQTNAIVINSGLNRLMMPSNTSISYFGFDDTLIFKSTSLQINLFQGNGLSIDFLSSGSLLSISSDPELGTLYKSVQDNQVIATTNFPPHSILTAIDDGGVIINDGGQASVVDAQGHLFKSIIGDSDTTTHLNALVNGIAIVPNNGESSDQTIFIDYHSTFLVNPEDNRLIAVSPADESGLHHITVVDSAGTTRVYLGVTDVDAWMDAIHSGENNDDLNLARTTITISASGQVSVQSSDLDKPFGPGNSTIVTLLDSFAVDIADEMGTQELFINNDGSIDIFNIFENRTFGDPNSGNAITLIYGENAQPTLSWGDNQLTLSPSYGSETNDDGSVTLTKGSISFQLSEGEIVVNLGEEELHINLNEADFIKTVDQNGNDLNILLGSDARYLINDVGVLTIETDGPNGEIFKTELKASTTPADLNRFMEFGDADNRVIVRNNLITDTWTVEKGWNSLIFPEDTTESYDSIDGSLKLDSKTQSLTVEDGNIIFNMHSSDSGDLILRDPASGNLSLQGPDGELIATYPDDAQYSNFPDDSMIITSESLDNQATLIDGNNHIFNSFGDGDTSTQLISLSADPFAPLTKDFAVVSNDGNGTDQAFIIDDSYTLTGNDNGDLIAYRQDDESNLYTIIQVDNATGDMLKASGISDINTFIDAIHSGGNVDDLATTLIKVSVSGQVSLQSKDFDQPVALGDGIISTLKASTTEEADVNAVEIVNERGDFQMIINADGSIKTFNALENHVFGDPNSDNAIELTYGFDSQAVFTWGDGNQFTLPASYSSETSENGTMTFSSETSGMRIQVSELGIINLSIVKDQTLYQSIHIDPNGQSSIVTLDQDGNHVQTLLNNDTHYTLDQSGMLTIKSTGADGESFVTQLQSIVSGSGTFTTLNVNTINVHDVSLKTGVSVIDDPILGQMIFPLSQISSNDTPATFNLINDIWTDQHGIELPNSAIPSIIDEAHIQFSLEDSDSNRIIYDLDSTSFDLINVTWFDDAGNQLAELSKGTAPGTYTFIDSHGTRDLFLNNDLTLTSTAKLITSDGSIDLFATDGSDGFQPVAINTTGQLVDINEVPVVDNPITQLPEWAQIELFQKTDLSTLAQAYLTYGIDNPPYWAVQIANKMSDSDTTQLNQQIMALLAQQGTEALNDPSKLPDHGAELFFSLSDQDQAQTIAWAQQQDDQIQQDNLITEHGNDVLMEHENLLTQITTPIQLDQLIDASMNGAALPDWAIDILSQLNMEELDRFFDTLETQVDNKFSNSSDIDVTSIINTLENIRTNFKQNQANEIYPLARQIADMEEESAANKAQGIGQLERDSDGNLVEAKSFNFSDWAEQELENPESQFSSLDTFQQAQLNATIEQLEQDDQALAADRAREFIITHKDIFDDRIIVTKTEFDDILFENNKDLSNYQLVLLQQYIKEFSFDYAQGFIPSWLNNTDLAVAHDTDHQVVATDLSGIFASSPEGTLNVLQSRIGVDTSRPLEIQSQTETAWETLALAIIGLFVPQNDSQLNKENNFWASNDIISNFDGDNNFWNAVKFVFISTLKDGLNLTIAGGEKALDFFEEAITIVSTDPFTGLNDIVESTMKIFSTLFNINNKDLNADKDIFEQINDDSVALIKGGALLAFSIFAYIGFEGLSGDETEAVASDIDKEESSWLKQTLSNSEEESGTIVSSTIIHIEPPKVRFAFGVGNEDFDFKANAQEIINDVQELEIFNNPIDINNNKGIIDERIKAINSEDITSSQLLIGTLKDAPIAVFDGSNFDDIIAQRLIQEQIDDYIKVGIIDEDTIVKALLDETISTDILSNYFEPGFFQNITDQAQMIKVFGDTEFPGIAQTITARINAVENKEITSSQLLEGTLNDAPKVDSDNLNDIVSLSLVNQQLDAYLDAKVIDINDLINALNNTEDTNVKAILKNTLNVQMIKVFEDTEFPDIAQTITARINAVENKEITPSQLLEGTLKDAPKVDSDNLNDIVSLSLVNQQLDAYLDAKVININDLINAFDNTEDTNVKAILKNTLNEKTVSLLKQLLGPVDADVSEIFYLIGEAFILNVSINIFSSLNLNGNQPEDDTTSDPDSNPDSTTEDTNNDMIAGNFNLDTLEMIKTNTLLDEISGNQPQSHEDALVLANDLLSDSSITSLFDETDPDTLADDILNSIKINNAYFNQIALFQSLPSDKQDEIINSIALAPEDIDKLSIADRITISAVFAASGQSQEEFLSNTSASPDSADFSNAMTILQIATTPEFIEQLKSGDTSLSAANDAETLLSQSNEILATSNFSDLVNAEAALTFQNLILEIIDDSDENDNQIDTLSDVQSSELLDDSAISEQEDSPIVVF